MTRAEMIVCFFALMIFMGICTTHIWIELIRIEDKINDLEFKLNHKLASLKKAESEGGTQHDD